MPHASPRPPSRDSPLKSSAPAVLPGNPDHVEVASGPGEYAGAAEEFDRVVPIHGQCEGHTHAHVLLQIIAPHAVERRAPAGVVGAVQRAPHTGAEVVDEVSLHGADGVLLKGLAAEKLPLSV